MLIITGRRKPLLKYDSLKRTIPKTLKDLWQSITQITHGLLFQKQQWTEILFIKKSNYNTQLNLLSTKLIRTLPVVRTNTNISLT